MTILKFRPLTAGVVLILILAAVTALAVWHVYRHMATLRQPDESGGEAQRTILAAPFFDRPLPGEETGTASSDASEKQPTVPGKAKTKTKPAAPPVKNGLDRYAVQARRAASGDYLPDDDSLTPNQIRESVNSDKKPEKNDWGDSAVGELFHKAEEILDDVDDATLDASRKVLGTLASPDKARIRPEDDGVRLHIHIPTN